MPASGCLLAVAQLLKDMGVAETAGPSPQKVRVRISFGLDRVPMTIAQLVARQARGGAVMAGEASAAQAWAWDAA